MTRSARSLAPREELADLLGASAGLLQSSARLTVPIDDLQVHVDGIGPLVLPVTAARAKKLCEFAAPARYGRGEQTLTDPQVRNTWHVPSDRVTIDWGGRLPELLDEARGALGLPRTCRLGAQFHSMLVYERGQFFVAHQDSVTDDDMLATLVVMLPSAHTGGELVVHDVHGEESYAGSRTEATCVAFYADRLHEVKPVRTGYRITLTFNLLVEGSTTPCPGAWENDIAVEQLARLLRRHFATARVGRYDSTPLDPPLRLAYLLDHQYTARGLSWERLKGVDAERAGLLRAAADRADCDVVLALSEVHETWDAYEHDAYGDWYDRDVDDVDDVDDDSDVDSDGDGAFDDGDLGSYEVNSLVESEFGLTHWTDPGGTTIEQVRLSLDDDEVCTSTPSANLRPYEQAFEGYMGNYGNTLDLWYRRAALLVWPRELAFANRAQASPSWAVQNLMTRWRAAKQDEQREQVRAELASMMPLWHQVASGAPHQDRLLGKALQLAVLVDDEAAAAALLRPFRVETLSPTQVPALIRLADRHGQRWADDVVGEWFGQVARPDLAAGRREWLSTLPALAGPLLPAPGLAELVLTRAWAGLEGRIGSALAADPPSAVSTQLATWGMPLAAVLEATALASAPAVRDRIVSACRTRLRADERVIACLMPALSVGAMLPDDVRRDAGFAALARPVADRLRARLACPVRADDDWSIVLPPGCTCELCVQLGTFLAARSRQLFEWPLRQDRRSHVHARLDRAELPVRHQTRRVGSPFTLVLTKTEELHGRERRAREADQHDLARLEVDWGLGGQG